MSETAGWQVTIRNTARYIGVTLVVLYCLATQASFLSSYLDLPQGNNRVTAVKWGSNSNVSHADHHQLEAMKHDIFDRMDMILEERLKAKEQQWEAEKKAMIEKLESMAEEHRAASKKWEEEKRGISSELQGFLLHQKQSLGAHLQATKAAPSNSGLESALVPSNSASQVAVQYDPKESIGACLIMMDDNHFLIEWLAYHWFVLPLRRLVVLVDPNSKSSPQPILDRWKGRMNISYIKAEDINAQKSSDLYFTHIMRQNEFYRQCARTLKEEGHSWFINTDTDEYMLINPRTRIATDPMYKLGRDDLTIPSQAEPGSVLTLLREAFPSDNNNNIVTEEPDPKTEGKPYLHGRPCVSVTRKNFGTLEFEKSNTTKYHHVWNTSHFQTHRWRHHAPNPPIGKMIVDLSRVNQTSLEKPNAVEIHRSVKDYCTQLSAWNQDNKNAFLQYHFSGTLEQILFRSNDSRMKEGNGTAYRIERYFDDQQKGQGAISPTDIQGWLDGFVESVGVEEAQRLLEHVGKPHEASYLQGRALRRALL